MSWTTSVPATPAPEFEAAVEAAQLPIYEGYPPYTVEAEEQLAAAKAAAIAIFRSGALSAPSDPNWFVACGLSGHANAGHAPTPGWSNDSVYVSVYRADSPITPPSQKPPVEG